MIEKMRQRRYPGSEVTIEETLEPEANYERYVASYQSEGNTIFALLTVPQGDPPNSGWPVIVLNHGYIPPDQYRTTCCFVHNPIEKIHSLSPTATTPDSSGDPAQSYSISSIAIIA